MTHKSKPTIALTGATGFLGSHLMASLLTKGYNIVSFRTSGKKRVSEGTNFQTFTLVRN